MVDVVLDELMRPVAEYSCNLANEVGNALTAIGEMCIEPGGSCLPDMMNADAPVELFTISDVLTVSAKVDLKACAHVKDAGVNCDQLVSFLRTKADEWTNQNIKQPARAWLPVPLPATPSVGAQIRPDAQSLTHNTNTTQSSAREGGWGRREQDSGA